MSVIEMDHFKIRFDLQDSNGKTLHVRDNVFIFNCERFTSFPTQFAQVIRMIGDIVKDDFQEVIDGGNLPSLISYTLNGELDDRQFSFRYRDQPVYFYIITGSTRISHER